MRELIIVEKYIKEIKKLVNINLTTLEDITLDELDEIDVDKLDLMNGIHESINELLELIKGYEGITSIDVHFAKCALSVSNLSFRFIEQMRNAKEMRASDLARVIRLSKSNNAIILDYVGVIIKN